MMSSNKWSLNTGLTVVTLVDDECQQVFSQHWFDCSDLSG